jgi:superfamily II DNA/RNA helicase
LNGEAFTADAIHGDLKQSRRERVIAAFRQQKYRILVATDVVARGLDIPHIAHVINYDLPQVAEDYIHRIGRTARAGASGHSLSFVAPSERHKWRAIEQLLNPNAANTDTQADAPRREKPKSWRKPSGGKPFGHKRFGSKPHSGAGAGASTAAKRRSA